MSHFTLLDICHCGWGSHLIPFQPLCQRHSGCILFLSMVAVSWYSLTTPPCSILFAKITEQDLLVNLCWPNNGSANTEKISQFNAIINLMTNSTFYQKIFLSVYIQMCRNEGWHWWWWWESYIHRQENAGDHILWWTGTWYLRLRFCKKTTVYNSI